MKTNAKTFLVAPKGAVSHANVSQNQFSSSTDGIEIWINTAEIMKFLGVDERTVKRLRKKGCLPFYKMGGVILHPLKLTNELMLAKVQSDYWRKI
ncbi:helix-turn-helix domain-containing protein [Subsaxibacter sp. CAU 1640]|uniref:helix-turn-helix domain-containing protein n=1 Tax=Subsaxibacter sp. CAU 1640 TaxID=2933271 RepID=UPI0020068340|nr:helix-turn-helix domain-containing protein [Subsaxibacter sp. CAU 1640]MCK7591928.1 helix-turn-helix domain-containing protein [Subsaxibacter sp. CAU 1640]